MEERILASSVGSQGEVWKTLPNPLKEGEVVLVANDREKHLNWKMGLSDSSFLDKMEDAVLLLSWCSRDC